MEHVYFYQGNPSEITRPLYGIEMKPIVEYSLSSTGELGTLSVNEFNQGVLSISRMFSYSGEFTSVTRYRHFGDSTIAIKQYYNSETGLFDREDVEIVTVYQNDMIHRLTGYQSNNLVFDWKFFDIQLDKYGNWLEKNVTHEYFGQTATRNPMWFFARKSSITRSDDLNLYRLTRSTRDQNPRISAFRRRRIRLICVPILLHRESAFVYRVLKYSRAFPATNPCSPAVAFRSLFQKYLLLLLPFDR